MNARRWPRVAAALAGLAAASLVLSGCIASMIPEASEPRPDRSKPPHTEGVSAELLPFYSQELDWSDCGDGFDCATVTAPLDWENPGDGEIELAIVRYATSTEPLGSLLINPGGPGSSGYDIVRDAVYFAAGDLMDHYDVVGFDPRGVGRSTAVTCYDAEDMDRYLYDVPEAPRGSEEWEAELAEAHKQFAEACEKNSGGILPHITTVNSAHDMDLLRGVLGDEKLSYLGYSYGTFLGATYAKLHPERVGRLVLDGAIDPSVPGIDVGTTQALGFESALRSYMEHCLGSAACPFSGTVDQAMTDLGALLASVDARPLRNGDGRMLGADSLMTGIVAALYSEESWRYLTQALDAAMAGDPSIAFLLADSYNSREDGVYLDNQSEAFRAYNCVDYPIEDDPAAEEAALEKLREEAPTIAPYWQGPDSCADWPYPPSGTRGEITAPGTPPIIVIGTTGDPATPYEWSVALAAQLESGVLVTNVGEGHTGYNKGNRCVDSAVIDFFVEGTVPEDGLRCE